MAWFGVRSIVKFDSKADGKNVFEERIVCFSAPDADKALERAAEEVRDYADLSELDEIHAQLVSYRQDDETLVDGYEVWSELYETELSLDDFFQERYAKYEYTPDSD